MCNLVSVLRFRMWIQPCVIFARCANWRRPNHCWMYPLIVPPWFIPGPRLYPIVLVAYCAMYARRLLAALVLPVPQRAVRAP